MPWAPSGKNTPEPLAAHGIAPPYAHNAAAYDSSSGGATTTGFFLGRFKLA
jgi:hypothetical protein